MSSVSDIKLIRTDTTLDLSQKAEKRYRLLYEIEGVPSFLPGHVGQPNVCTPGAHWQEPPSPIVAVWHSAFDFQAIFRLEFPLYP